jgi:hypothetical protein
MPSNPEITKVEGNWPSSFLEQRLPHHEGASSSDKFGDYALKE